MPTTRRRHAITETPPVQAALDELRDELGTDRVPLSELVVIGARGKLNELRQQRSALKRGRQALAQKIRSGESLVDVAAAVEARRSGWTR